MYVGVPLCMPVLHVPNSLTGGQYMMAYLSVITSAHEEFQFAACMAYDVAFRKRVANFRLFLWGHIDPQVYSKAFTSASKAKPGAHCSLCLSTFHITSECPFTPVNQPKRHGGAMLASKSSPPPQRKRDLSQL